MRSVQAYHLIARNKAVENVTWKEQTGGKDYKYTATLVAGGIVYDHVRFRARGGVWRYAMGKNMWKVDFPDGHKLRPEQYKIVLRVEPGVAVAVTEGCTI